MAYFFRYLRVMSCSGATRLNRAAAGDFEKMLHNGIPVVKRDIILFCFAKNLIFSFDLRSIDSSSQPRTLLTLFGVGAEAHIANVRQRGDTVKSSLFKNWILFIKTE